MAIEGSASEARERRIRLGMVGGGSGAFIGAVHRIAARLDEVNLALLEIVRHLLGISTPLLTTAPPSHSNVDRLIEQVSAVGGTQYLSGTGGLAYMGEDAPARFRDAGIELVWSNHAMTTGDSIVTVLMDHDDPMESVLARH